MKYESMQKSFYNGHNQVDKEVARKQFHELKSRISSSSITYDREMSKD